MIRTQLKMFAVWENFQIHFHQMPCTLTFTPWNCAASVPSTLEADTSKTFLLVRVLLAQISLCLEILSGAKFRLHMEHWARPAFGANLGFSLLVDDIFRDWPREIFGCFVGDCVILFWGWIVFCLLLLLFLLFLLLLKLSLDGALEKFDTVLGSEWGVVFAGDWSLSKL